MAKKYVGIDIGGTKIHAVVFSEGKILWRMTVPTPKTRKDKFLTVLDEIIQSVIGDINIAGIGIGVASPVDAKGVLNPAHIPCIRGFNIHKFVEKTYKTEVRVENDSRCFAWGEYLHGAGKKSMNMVGVTLGTGIGSGWVLNGTLYSGIHGSGGEVGHMLLESTKSFENLACSQYIRTRSGHTPKEVEDMADTGDSLSRTIYMELGVNLGRGLANIVNILDPEVIVLGGGITHAKNHFLTSALKEMKTHIYSEGAQKVKVVCARLDRDAGAVGAASLFDKSSSL